MDLITKNAMLTREYDESFDALILAFEDDNLSEELLAARSRFNRAAHYRAEFLRTEVAPLIRISSLDGGDALSDAIIAQLVDSGDIYLNHMGRWTLSEILRDWDGYRKMASELIQACRDSSLSENIDIDALLKRLPPEAIISRA